jgi:hypothetical protein
MKRHFFPAVALFSALAHCGAEPSQPPAGDAATAPTDAAPTDAAPQPTADTAAVTNDSGCTGSMERCDGTCTDLDSDRGNCGMCGWRCSSALSCTGGQCVAP